MRQVKGEEVEGVMLDPVDYSGCRMVSVKDWDSGVAERIGKVKLYKGMGGAGSRVRSLNDEEERMEKENPGYVKKRFVTTKGWGGVNMNSINPYIERAAKMTKENSENGDPSAVVVEELMREGNLKNVQCVTHIMREQMWQMDDAFEGTVHELDW